MGEKGTVKLPHSLVLSIWGSFKDCLGIVRIDLSVLLHSPAL